MSEELTAFLATSYCSGSALAVFYRKNLEDSKLSLQRWEMFMVWNIRGLRSPSNHSAVVCRSYMGESRGSQLRLLFPVCPQTTSAKRGSPGFPAIYSCMLLLSSLLLIPEFCSENWLGQKLIISFP